MLESAGMSCMFIINRSECDSFAKSPAFGADKLLQLFR
jgi:hypothetical protein